MPAQLWKKKSNSEWIVFAVFCSIRKKTDKVILDHKNFEKYLIIDKYVIRGKYFSCLIRSGV